ncbi:M61 family metallopeptidase [Parvibium lacunae]|uniref:M61 family peptidase n=1 Tax=Parvibium lacunae TaxID=1888893 RepID=A0A368L0G9_9BURK|nr:PDZ domain-containing protein [Parvibium lacunae]RCS56781.1 M61 family peptidase [Parvibium lacunae]
MPHYRLYPIDPAGHLFQVILSLPASTTGYTLRLPAWIPGSYMIREFARHIITLKATSNQQPLHATKQDKHSWQIAGSANPIEITYQVYAWDLSVRAAHLDESHGFFNGSSVFLQVVGLEVQPHQVEICPPAGITDWRVATTLPRPSTRKGGASKWGFGLYQANDYDELIDHPVEMGRFTLAQFKAHGVPHAVAITGLHDTDTKRLCADLKKICEAQIAFFEPKTAQAPFKEYLFLVMAVGNGYGGLEHRSSTALLCNRTDLPYPNMGDATDDYIGFLGLCSHEYFHSWNVKRIQPAAFRPYDLTQENYTRLLWLFEGFTSYYDDLFLLRCDLISAEQYLKLLTKTINQVMRGSGRHKQSVADSSFDAWIKYYRQEENAPNAIVSYYTKGALIALALDLTLRQQSAGQHHLDDIMRALWAQHGTPGRGLPEEGLPKLIEQVTGLKLARPLRTWTESTADLPLPTVFKAIGVAWKTEPTRQPSLSSKTIEAHGLVKLTQVLEGGAAHQAGLSAGDVLVAVDGIKATPSNVEHALKRRPLGTTLFVLAFRRDELREFTLVRQADVSTEIRLAIVDQAKWNAWLHA